MQTGLRRVQEEFGGGSGGSSLYRVPDVLCSLSENGTVPSAPSLSSQLRIRSPTACSSHYQPEPYVVASHQVLA